MRVHNTYSGDYKKITTKYNCYCGGIIGEMLDERNNRPFQIHCALSFPLILEDWQRDTLLG